VADMKTLDVVWAIGLLVLLLALALHALGQEITATVTGVVSDPSGRVISGAVIHVLDADKGIVWRTLITSGQGQYNAPLLPIGLYSVTAEAPGFKKDERAGIKLNVNDQRVVNFVLQVGAADQQVKVEADPLQVDLKTPAATGVISGTQILQLPLNTRNYALLVALQPGVSATLASDQLYAGVSGPNGSLNKVNFSINGSRPEQNNWTLDGVDNLDRGQNTVLLTYPSVESIEEFRLLRSNYSPEFPSGSAGQVIAMTRSGTRQFHGSVYEFFRNDLLAANNFFNNRNNLPRPPIRYNNFGFTIGGPLFIPPVYDQARNKTFFFYSEEWRRAIDYSTLTSGTMPTATQLQGTFSSPVCTQPIFDPATQACIGPTTTQITNFDPTAAAYIKDIYSMLPASGAGGSIVATAKNQYDFRGDMIRVDHILSPRLSIFGRFINNNIPTVESGGLLVNLQLPGVATTSTDSPGRGLAVRATMTLTPTLLNEIGYAYSYGAVVSNPVGTVSTHTSPDIRPVLPFASSLNRAPDLLFNAGQSIFGFGLFQDYNRNHAALDTMTKVAGRHTFKAGFTYSHYEKEENRGRDTEGLYSFYGNDPAGHYTFEQEWANFLLGNVANFSQANVGPTADIRQNVFEWFAQDEFRVRPNLTLSYGFRWSFFRQPTDGHGRASSFDPEAFDRTVAPAIDITTGLLVPGTATPVVNGLVDSNTSRFGDSLYRQNNWNLAPRIGLAWDPFGKGKTAVRAGYGIFFDNTSKSVYEASIFFNPPLVQNVSITNTNLSDPGSVTPDPNLIPGTVIGVGLNWIPPYTEQWNVDVQQQIGTSTLIGVGYYGNRGIHLPGFMDINEARPGAYLDAGVLPSGPIHSYNTQLLNYVRPYPGYSSINLLNNRFGSNYNSLQVQLQARIPHDSSLTVNYTLSHAFTDASDITFTPPQNSYDIGAEYANSAFDRRHILTASYVYTLPFHFHQNGWTGRLAGGWEFSGEVYAESGVPVTVTGTDIDPAGLGFLGSFLITPRPDQLGDPNRHAPHTVDQWFDTNVFAAPPAQGIRPGNARPSSVRGPGVIRLDAAVTKNTRIREGLGLQFRAEATNALNHTNLDRVNASFLDQSSFGKVGGARDPRIVQLGLKLTF
jgi:hypothetical protein